KIDRPLLTLAPGETVNVKLRISGGDVKLVGGADTRPFTIDVKTNSYDTPPLSLSGTYEKRAIVPAGLPVAGATLAALAMGGFAVYSAFLAPKPTGNVANETTAPISASASAAAAAPSVAIAGPASQAPQSAAPSKTPKPTPTPTSA